MMSNRAAFRIFFAPIVAWIVFSPIVWGAAAQRERRPVILDPSLYKAMEWRLIGPFRGGRVTAVAGIRGYRRGGLEDRRRRAQLEVRFRRHLPDRFGGRRRRLRI
jgi:hypothetical protein